jgi:hypothetical protein
MRDPASRVQLLSNLRFALEVMEERSHIGLDDKMAGAVRSTILRRIDETEKALRYSPTTQAAKQSGEEILTA